MPIRPELRGLYPADWREISRQIRFGRAGGRCETCARPHGAVVCCLPDGRWFDPVTRAWRSGQGMVAVGPDAADSATIRWIRVVLATAHLDHDPTHNSAANLRCLCQRCHLIHDRPYHRVRRWLTWRQRLASGDLFLGAYDRLGPSGAGLVVAMG